VSYRLYLQCAEVVTDLIGQDNTDLIPLAFQEIGQLLVVNARGLHNKMKRTFLRSMGLYPFLQLYQTFIRVSEITVLAQLLIQVGQDLANAYDQFLTAYIDTYYLLKCFHVNF